MALFILADRKIWAAVQLRRGPNVVGAFGLLQTFADALKFLFKEVIIPAGANKVLFLLAPLITATLAFAAWAVVPVECRLGGRQHQCRHSLYLRDLVARRVRHDHGRLGVELEIRVPLRLARRGADGVLRSLHRLRADHGAAVRGLAEPLRHRAWRRRMAGSLFTILFPMFVVFFISALAETQRPPFDLLEAESELVAGFMVEYSSTPFLLFFLGEYVNVILLCGLMTVLFLGGWLPPSRIWPLTAIPGRDLVHPEAAVPVLLIRDGEGDRAALSLRPADAAGLESVPAAVAGLGGADRRLGVVFPHGIWAALAHGGA